MDRDQSLEKFLVYQWNTHKPLQAIAFNEFRQTFIALDNNGKLWKDMVYKKILEKYYVQEINANILVQDYLENFAHYCIVFPDVLSVLKKFRSKQIKLGIITNGREDLQSSVIASCGLRNVMDVILISESEGIKKPDTAIFKIGLDKLSLLPSASVFIGDNPQADIQGGYNAGMETVWKENHIFSPPDTSITSAIFNKFEELPDIINQIEDSA